MPGMMNSWQPEGMGRSLKAVGVRLGQVGPTVLSALRCEPRVLRWMPAALLVIATGLSAWKRDPVR
jgi:hypothetical protein